MDRPEGFSAIASLNTARALARLTAYGTNVPIVTLCTREVVVKRFASSKSLTAGIVVAAVGLAFAPTPNAFAGPAFNNADLKGDYSWEWNDPDNNAVRVGVFSADGAGSCTLLRADWLSADPLAELSCSGYSVNANGSAVVGGPGSATTLFLNNNNAGADGYSITAITGAIVPFKMVKQNSPSGFNNADLKGSYSWRGPAGPSTLFATLFTADGNGGCTALSAFNCVYDVRPNGVVRISTDLGTTITLVLNNRGAGAVGINGGRIVTLTKQ